MNEELPAHARNLLRTYRDAHDIPADVQARIQAALFAAPDPRRRSPWRPVLGVTLVAASMLLGIALRPLGDAWMSRHSPVPHDAASHELSRTRPQGATIRHEPRLTQETSPAATTPSPTPLDPIPDHGIPPASGSATTPERRTTTPRASSSSRHGMVRDVAPMGPPPAAAESTGAPLERVGSSLADERRIVALAWSALATKELDRAAELATEHARAFPRGALLPEREAIEALVSCARDRSTTTTSARFLERHAGSPLAARVRDACSRP